jgi:uncharacterized protein (TIGR03067 family)
MPRSLVLAFLLALPALADEPDPEPVPSTKVDLKKMQGSWDIVRGEENGRDMGKEVVGTVVRITGERIVIKEHNRKREEPATLKLDASKRPAQIDITPDERARGEVLRGIYRLSKDELVLVFTEDKKARPARFDAKECVKLVLKRQRAK